MSKKNIFLVFENHPTVHSGGVSRRRVVGCGCWRMLQVTHNMQQVIFYCIGATNGIRGRFSVSRMRGLYCYKSTPQYLNTYFIFFQKRFCNVKSWWKFFTVLARGRFSLEVAMSVCLFATLGVIVKYAQTVNFSVFCQKIDCTTFFLKILNLKGHQQRMICSKVTAIKITKKGFLYT